MTPRFAARLEAMETKGQKSLEAREVMHTSEIYKVRTMAKMKTQCPSKGRQPPLSSTRSFQVLKSFSVFPDMIF